MFVIKINFNIVLMILITLFAILPKLISTGFTLVENALHSRKTTAANIAKRLIVSPDTVAKWLSFLLISHI